MVFLKWTFIYRNGVSLFLTITLCWKQELSTFTSHCFKVFRDTIFCTQLPVNGTSRLWMLRQSSHDNRFCRMMEFCCESFRVKESNCQSVKSDISFFSFFDSGLSDVLQNNIKKSQYDRPTPIQKWAIPVIMDGRDVMACAVTGSGKTVSTLHLYIYQNFHLALHVELKALTQNFSIAVKFDLHRFLIVAAVFCSQPNFCEQGRIFLQFSPDLHIQLCLRCTRK